jgi:clan AA aspartic protease (TIGR02281 family)
MNRILTTAAVALGLCAPVVAHAADAALANPLPQRPFEEKYRDAFIAMLEDGNSQINANCFKGENHFCIILGHYGRSHDAMVDFSVGRSGFSSSHCVDDPADDNVQICADEAGGYRLPDDEKKLRAAPRIPPSASSPAFTANFERVFSQLIAKGAKPVPQCLGPTSEDGVGTGRSIYNDDSCTLAWNNGDGDDGLHVDFYVATEQSNVAFGYCEPLPDNRNVRKCEDSDGPASYEARVEVNGKNGWFDDGKPLTRWARDQGLSDAAVTELVRRVKSTLSQTPQPTPTPPPVKPPISANSIPIYLDRDGGSVRIDVELGSVTKRMLIDTGADGVSIPESVADRLLLQREAVESESAVVTLANGREETQRGLRILSVSIGGHVLHDIYANVAPDSSEPLLGFPVLNHVGRFTIDTNAGVLIFG